MLRATRAQSAASATGANAGSLAKFGARSPRQMCGRWDERRARQLASKQTPDARKQTELRPINVGAHGEHEHHVPDALSNAPDLPNEATHTQRLQTQLPANRMSYIIANFAHRQIVVCRVVLRGKL